MGQIITEAYVIDGKLLDVKNTCEYRGWKLVAKLKTLKHSTVVVDGAGQPANSAEYESKQWLADIWKELIFVAIKPADTEETVKKEHTDKGEVFVFVDDVFVESKITRVMGFGIPNNS